MSSKVEAAMLFRDLLMQGWTQRALARNKNGRDVEGDSDEAVAWCVVGAWDVAEIRTGVLLCNEVREEVGGDVVYWNNHPARTHAEVLDLADRVLRRVKEQEDK